MKNSPKKPEPLTRGFVKVGLDELHLNNHRYSTVLVNEAVVFRCNLILTALTSMKPLQNLHEIIYLL
jgi:hypothetical protein